MILIMEFIIVFFNLVASIILIFLLFFIIKTVIPETATLNSFNSLYDLMFYDCSYFFSK